MSMKNTLKILKCKNLNFYVNYFFLTYSLKILYLTIKYYDLYILL